MQSTQQPVDTELRVIFDVLPVTLEGQWLVVCGQRFTDTSLSDEDRRATKLFICIVHDLCHLTQKNIRICSSQVL